MLCSGVNFVGSLLIPLPRSSDILSKEAWKHLTDKTFQRVGILYLSCLLALTDAQKLLLHEASTRQQLFAHAITVIVCPNQVGLYANGQPAAAGCGGLNFNLH